MALNISAISGVVSVYRTADDTYGKASFESYPVGAFKKFIFLLGIFQLEIGGDIHECIFTNLRVNGATPYDFDSANILLSAVFNPCCSDTGTTGSFTTGGTYTVTVVNGIITSIAGGV